MTQGAADVEGVPDAAPAVGRGFVPWDTAGPLPAVPEGALDPPIRALVAALNHTGWVRTVYSCAGHPDEPDSVARGRRQAHVDGAIADLARWRRFARATRRRVHDLLRQETEGFRAALPDMVVKRSMLVRCAEGSLGPVPEWLLAALAPASRAADTVPTSWWRRVLRPGGADRVGWHYRRLVFEPDPYDAPPWSCRHVLDLALAAACAALAEM